MIRSFAARLSTAIVAAFGLAIGVSFAQAPHPIPPLARALHERALEADVIAIGVAGRLAAGRIAFASGVAIRGAAPAEFELKTSPLRPPRVAAGDRVLLFLRGDRSPYVLAGEPSEILRIANEAEARALAAALPELLAAGQDRSAIASSYQRWVASRSAVVRALGHAGLAAIAEQRAGPPGV